MDRRGFLKGLTCTALMPYIVKLPTDIVLPKIVDIFLPLKNAINSILEYTDFEPNDDYTRFQVRQLIHQYMSVAAGPEWKWEVICDETNNFSQKNIVIDLIMKNATDTFKVVVDRPRQIIETIIGAEVNSPMFDSYSFVSAESHIRNSCWEDDRYFHKLCMREIPTTQLTEEQIESAKEQISLHRECDHHDLGWSSKGWVHNDYSPIVTKEQIR